MYSLPIIKTEGTGFPVQEHSALLLVTALLHDDLDDRCDGIRACLEIDPLFAVWAVTVADELHGSQLRSMSQAVRWISSCLLREFDAPALLTPRVTTASERLAWRAVAKRAVATGRLARQRSPASTDGVKASAFWCGMLSGAASQLQVFTQRNGHSPLHEFLPLPLPSWLAEFTKPRDDDAVKQITAMACKQVSETPGCVSEFVSDEECELWFRAYPEFRTLAPSLLKKLVRSRELEEQFQEVLRREKLAALQQFAYGAGHEINNPLANISTRAQTLLYEEQDNDRRHKLVAINDQAYRAYEMIADLMLFANPPVLDPTHVPLQELLSTVRDELSAAAVSKGIQFRLAPEPNAIHVYADQVQLAVAIKAICQNGIDAMQSGGLLTIETQMINRRQVEIAIQDDGPGLSELDHRHLFDPFFSGREAGRGLGFGLSKAWRIVKQHHGTIHAESRRSCGSKFTIVMPRSVTPSTKPRRLSESA